MKSVIRSIPPRPPFFVQCLFSARSRNYAKVCCKLVLAALLAYETNTKAGKTIIASCGKAKYSCEASDPIYFHKYNVSEKKQRTSTKQVHA